MVEQSRISKYAEELRRGGQFEYLVLTVVAQGLYYALSKKQKIPELSVDPEQISRLKSQFEGFFNQELLEKYAKSILERVDRWLEEGRPAVSRSLVDLIPPQYQSDEGWKDFSSEYKAAEQYVIWIESRLAAYEIQRKIDFENLPVSMLRQLLGLPPAGIGPRLFQNEAIAAIPTSAPIVSSIKAQLRKDLWDQDCEGLAYFRHAAKGNPKNYIEHKIASTGDITLLPWEQARQIIDKFGPDTVKLQFIFAAYAMRTDTPWESSYTLKASDIVQELGWDRNHHSTGPEKLNHVAKLAFALDCLIVKAVWIEGKGKKRLDVSTPIGRMWEVLVEPHYDFEFDQQLNLFTGKPDCPREIYLTIRPGLWTQHYLNKAGCEAREALFQFGYIAQDILRIDTYHDWLAFKLMAYLYPASRYHPDGEYTVQRLLEIALPVIEIEVAQQNPKKGYDLKQRWDNFLTLLTQLENPWQIVFDSSYPEWLRPRSRSEKPPGTRKIKTIDWLLAAKITIKPPKSVSDLMRIRAESSAHYTLVAPKTATHLTGDQITKARQAKGWTVRKLGGTLGVSFSLVSYWEKGSRTPSTEAEAQLRKILDIQD